VVHHGDAALDFVVKDGKLVLTAPADAPKLEDYKLDDVDRGLELLTFEDVTPDKDAAASKVGEQIGTSVFTTTDGLAVHVTVLKGEKDIWARFSATGDGAGATDKTKDAAAKLNAKLAGWTFQLGTWKQAALVPDLDALKAAPPAAAPSAAAPMAPGMAPTVAPPVSAAPGPATSSAPSDTPATPAAAAGSPSVPAAAAPSGAPAAGAPSAAPAAPKP
jgi:hypothetical protein